MRRAAPDTAYRIVYSPEAWAEIGSVFRDEFELLRGVLKELSQNAGEARAQGLEDGQAEPRKQRSTQVGRLTLIYELDPGRRLLTLLRVLRDRAG